MTFQLIIQHLELNNSLIFLKIVFALLSMIHFFLSIWKSLIDFLGF